MHFLNNKLRIQYKMLTPPPSIPTGSFINDIHTRNSLTLDSHLISPGG